MITRQSSDLTLTALSARPHVSPERERELIALAQAGDLTARNELIVTNGRLIVKIASVTRSAMPLADRCQAAIPGVIRAIEKFEPDRGLRFSTYATYWIKQAVRRAAFEWDRNIRLPVHLADLIVKVNRVEAALTPELTRQPTPAEIADRAGVSLHLVERALRVRSDTLSLDWPLNDEGDFTLTDQLESSDNTEVQAGQALTADRVEKLLNKLTPREARILRLRYGLFGSRPHKLWEIGDKYGLTRERIRQIEKEALGKLRRVVNGS